MLTKKKKKTLSVLIFFADSLSKKRHCDNVMTSFRVNKCHQKIVKSVDRKSEIYIVDCIPWWIVIPLVESSPSYDFFLDEMSVIYISGNSQASINVTESFDLEKQQHYAGCVETLCPERLQRKHLGRLWHFLFSLFVGNSTVIFVRLKL